MLVNGAGGIAVGMATSIPPHNLGEIIDGTLALIENKDVKINVLLKTLYRALISLLVASLLEKKLLKLDTMWVVGHSKLEVKLVLKHKKMGERDLL